MYLRYYPKAQKLKFHQILKRYSCFAVQNSKRYSCFAAQNSKCYSNITLVLLCKTRNASQMLRLFCFAKLERLLKRYACFALQNSKCYSNVTLVLLCKTRIVTQMLRLFCFDVIFLFPFFSFHLLMFYIYK